ncbi:MAG: hypothetical protein UW18_C0016G0006 [Microgenomates group bacterium GW2011_GWF1_44_10]|nr:MAG: hypothetical protein UW18_C0016G0006 [Microgenomates group bacterium GW2011_GWF1_44_10]
MKKGFNVNSHLDLVPAYYDIVYINAMYGKVVDPMSIKYWDATNALKRGLIHQPVLSVTNDVNENASAFLGLLNDLSYSGWNNGIPLMVDVWKAPKDFMYNLDHIRQHGIYITQYYKPTLKPLLRVIVSEWEKWYESNATETMRLLNDYRIMLCQPGALKPEKLSGIGVSDWWEYDWGLYAHDPETIYDGVVDLPDPIEEPEPEPEPLPVVIGEQTVIRKWKISLFGGLIKGTIEAVDE